MKKEEVKIQSGSLTLRGEIYLPEHSPAPGILMCHAMHAQGFRWLPLYRMFAESAAEKGFVCLLFDFRGCGASEGVFDYGWGEQHDARAALQFLMRRGEVDRSNCFVVGRSLGGTVGLYSSIGESGVRGYALWATPPDHHHNVRDFIVKRRGRLGYLTFLFLAGIARFNRIGGTLGFDLFGLRLSPRDLRRKLMALRPQELVSTGNHPPILLLIGDRDEYVTLAEAQSFEESIGGRKRLVVLQGTGHTFKGVEAEAVSITLDWFEQLSVRA